MKTHVKLLVLAMVLVMFALCLAACGGGSDTTTTTTEAATTTTAATTTAAAAGYDPADFVLTVDETTGYTGKSVKVVDVKKPSGVRTTITYNKVDENGNVLAELGTTAPTDCGIYTITVTFSWQNKDKTDPLPPAMSETFTVVPGSLAAVKDDFGAKDIEILYKNVGMDFDPLNSTLLTGSLPKGIVASASIQKLADENATSGEAIGAKITSTNGAGWYLVTVTYAEAANLDNFGDENTVSHTAKVYAREIAKTVEKVDAAPAIDGVIDAAYGDFLFETAYQAYTSVPSTGAFDKIDMTQFVDPYTKAAALRISRGAKITDAMERDAASAKFYAVWDGEYVYIAIEITDDTKYARSADYTAQRNPWINDNLELYYVFGGDAVPNFNGATETYPTYKTVVRDSRTGEGGFTGIGSQRSHYFKDIECYVQGRDTAGDDTYVIEYKLVAKSETWSGTPGATGDAAYATFAGEALAAGDFIYLAYQLNDLMGLPTKRLNANGEYDPFGTVSETGEAWSTIEEYDDNIAKLPAEKLTSDYATTPDKESPWYNFETDAAAYVYSAGNRGVAAYLSQDKCVPMILQLGE